MRIRGSLTSLGRDLFTRFAVHERTLASENSLGFVGAARVWG